MEGTSWEGISSPAPGARSSYLARFPEKVRVLSVSREHLKETEEVPIFAFEWLSG